MEIPRNIFELIENEHFRKRPSMYLRGSRILDMVKFIDAYSICESHNNLDSGLIDFFNKLTFPIREEMASKFPDERHSNYHWYQMIEILADGKLERELPLFFELYDKYKSQ